MEIYIKSSLETFYENAGKISAHKTKEMLQNGCGGEFCCYFLSHFSSPQQQLKNLIAKNFNEYFEM